MPDSKYTSDQTKIKITERKSILAKKSRRLFTCAGIAGTGQAQWEAIMKKFYLGQQAACESTPLSIPKMARKQKKFPTGSTYTGDWNLLGMSGSGVYTFPQKGVTYIGSFDDGMFDGPGEIHYECGAIIKGKWRKGRIVEAHLMFSDGLRYDENWGYLRFPDRRYAEEIDTNISPAGDSYITPEKPPREIPPGFYDCGHGVYDPEANAIYSYDDFTFLLRSPSTEERDWIIANCRCNNGDEPIGPCPFLYEKWVEPLLEAEVPPETTVRTKEENGEKEVGFCGRGSRLSKHSSRSSKASKTSYFDDRRYSDLGSCRPFYTPPDHLDKKDSKTSARSRSSSISLTKETASEMDRLLRQGGYAADIIDSASSIMILDDDLQLDLDEHDPSKRSRRPPPKRYNYAKANTYKYT